MTPTCLTAGLEGTTLGCRRVLCPLALILGMCKRGMPTAQGRGQARAVFLAGAGSRDLGC